MSDSAPTSPPTLGEEIICAEQPAVASTRTDPVRVGLIAAQLRRGFDLLAVIGPAFFVFVSARAH